MSCAEVFTVPWNNREMPTNPPSSETSLGGQKRYRKGGVLDIIASFDDLLMRNKWARAIIPSLAQQFDRVCAIVVGDVVAL